MAQEEPITVFLQLDAETAYVQLSSPPGSPLVDFSEQVRSGGQFAGWSYDPIGDRVESCPSAGSSLGAGGHFLLH